MASNWQEPLTEIEVLGLTLIGEARGEPIEGIVAVGSNIRNRLLKFSNKYKSYKDVVLAPKQYSCWNTNDPNYSVLKDLALRMINGQILTDPHHRQCIWVASGIVNGMLIDNTKGATNYLTRTAYDKRLTDGMVWDDNPINPINIGNQVFFSI